MAFLFSLRRRHHFIFHAALPRTCIPAVLNKTTSLLRRGANFGFCLSDYLHFGVAEVALDCERLSSFARGIINMMFQSLIYLTIHL